MPLIFENKKDDFSFAVWYVDESLSFFFDRIKLSEPEEFEITGFNEKRKLEWIASRYLLSVLESNKQRSVCLKDEFGKPYLENSDKKISISHSGKYISAVISDFNIGMDIQIVSDKINRIKYKFLSEEELISCNGDLLVLNRYWTAKEALYKAYGKKGLSFKEDIAVEPFVKNRNHLESTGTVSKNGKRSEYKIYSKNIDESIVTIAKEKQKNEI